MDDDAPDLVMRLYWDCQKLQERLNQLPDERETRRGAILAFLGQMEAKYPDTIPEFQPDLSWFNVAQSVNMASLQGTLPLLDFFTYCCVNCHHILPDLAKLEEKWSEHGLAVVGVHSAKFEHERKDENVRHAVQRYGIRHPVCNDKSASLWRGLGVTCWPTQLLLSPTGSPLHVAMGEGHAGWMEELVEVVVEYYGERGSLTKRCPPFEEGKIEGSLLSYPGKVAAGLDKLVVADTGHHRLLVIEPSSGVVEKVIGTGQPGFTDGLLSKAQFRAPQGIAVVDGLIYVCDTENHLLRMVDLVKGTVETVAGTGAQAFDRVGGKQGKEQAISSPWDVCHVTGVDGGSGLLVAMAGIHQLWLFCITDLVWWKNLKFTSGTMVSVAGSGNEENRNNSYPAKAAFAQPSGVAATLEWIYVADSESSTIRRISRKDGAVKGLCGGEIDPMNLFAFGDLDGEGRAARLQHPLGVAVGEQGIVYVADSYNHKLKRVEMEGAKARVVTMMEGLSEPGGVLLTEDQQKLYIADTNAHAIQVVDLSSGVMEKLIIKMGSCEKEEEDNSVLIRHQVGPGEGVVNLRASAAPIKGLKLNSEAKSSWKLTVDAVQGGGWQFEPSGGLDPSSVDANLVCSVQYPELPSQGSVLTLRMKVYSCLTESNACLAPNSLRFLVTLLPSGEGENFSEIDLGNVFSHQK